MIKLSTNGSQIGGKFDRIEVSGKNVTIKDVVVEGEGITLYSNYNCSGLTVRNCVFRSRKNNAVKIIADNVGGVDENILFENCVFEFSRMGAELQNHGNTDYKIVGAKFFNCQFRAYDDGKYRYGLSLSGYGADTIVSGCTFDNCAKGIELVGFSNLSIVGCTVSGSTNSIIASNDRRMRGINISNCILNGQPHLYNCESSWLDDCQIKASYVEIKKSDNVTMVDCNVTSTGHYAIMLNEAKNCKVDGNTLTQTGSNYSVVRCYGKGATGNVVCNNALFMNKPKKGRWYDQMNGASGNTFKDNSQNYIQQKQ